MTLKKNKIWILTSIFLLVAIIPSTFLIFTGATVIVQDESPSIDSTIGDESVAADFPPHFFIYVGVQGFSITNGRQPGHRWIERNYIWINVYIKDEFGDPVDMIYVHIKLTLNTGRTIYLSQKTHSNGWANFEYQNFRWWPFKRGTYKCEIYRVTDYPGSIGHSWNHVLDTVPLIKSTTL